MGDGVACVGGERPGQDRRAIAEDDAQRGGVPNSLYRGDVVGAAVDDADPDVRACGEGDESVPEVEVCPGVLLGEAHGPGNQGLEARRQEIGWATITVCTTVRGAQNAGMLFFWVSEQKSARRRFWSMKNGLRPKLRMKTSGSWKRIIGMKSLMLEKTNVEWTGEPLCVKRVKRAPG